MNSPHSEITLRQLDGADAEEVSALAIRSKAVWGYSTEQMEVFRRELTITGEEIAARIAFGATTSGRLVGYYTVSLTGEGSAELEHLFVDPTRLKCGIGSTLLRHALAECQVRGLRSLTVLSDPNAAGFYDASNAALVEHIPSSIPGRSIPRYRFEVVRPELLEATGIDTFEVVETLTASQVEQLHRLIQQQWWGGNRSLDDVRIMAENSSLMIGLVDRSNDRLVGYCRVLTDFVFRATIYDVMVDQDFQGQGLGKRLLDLLTSHHKLQRVSLIYLACEPVLFPFYERWGFKVYDGRSEWMIKVQRPEG